MNLANKLTLSRIFLTFVFMFFLFSRGVLAKALALTVFIAAFVTDMLDGLIAKRANCVTDFGKLMDPIADKVLTLAAFLAFVEMELVPAWMVVIIMVREFSITGLRILALGKGKVIAAGEGGRHKTVSQFIAISVVLIFLILKEIGMKTGDFWNPQIERVWKDAIFLLMLFTMSLTLVSGISYLAKHKELYLNAKAG